MDTALGALIYQIINSRHVGLGTTLISTTAILVGDRSRPILQARSLKPGGLDHIVTNCGHIYHTVRNKRGGAT